MTQRPTDRTDPGAAVPGSAALGDDDPVENLWAWVDQPQVEEDVDLDGHRVTAVLVAMDAADWLSETLAALGAVRPGPDRVIAVDNASSDATARLLAEAAAAGTVDHVVTRSTPAGFGVAVADALQEVGAEPDADPGTDTDTDWLWLLHDDVLLTPDTLDRLLRRVAVDPELVVTGPKLIRPPTGAATRRGPVQLSEVGVSIAGTGRRDLGLEPGEVDQGQHDEPRAVLGVSTCAMLVRRDVWDELGGLSPALPAFRDGVDFGWRAHLAGHQVMTSPSAVAIHRQVGRAGLRKLGPAARHPLRLDRTLGLHVIQAHTRGPGRVLTWVRLVLGCVGLAIGYLIGKAPGRSLDELAAAASFAGHPERTRAIRAVADAVPVRPGAEEQIRGLRPPWWSGLALGLDRAGRALAERSADRAAGRDPEVTSLDELTGDDYAGPAARPPVWRSAVLITAVAAVIVALAASRSLLTAGRLTSTALLPSGSWHDGWTAWLSPVAGSAVWPAPWLGWVAVGSTLLFGQPEWLVTGLLCGLLPLAFLAAYPLLARLVPDRRVRWWGAVTWAVLPLLLGATNQGRVSVAVLALVLPLTGLALHRLATRSGLRAAWAGGVGLAALTAFEPVIMAVAVVAATVAALATRNLQLAGRAGLALVVPVLLWSPWWVSLVRTGHLGRLLLGPDPGLVPATALGAPATWDLLLGRAGGPGLPPLWVSIVVVGVVWLTALLALVLSPTNRVVRSGWVLGLVAMIAAVAASRLVGTVPPLSVDARPWVGGLLLVAFGGLLLAAASGLGEIFDRVATQSFGALQPLSVLAAILVAAVSLLGAGWYVVAGANDPLARDELQALPPYLRDAQLRDGVRTLAIRVDSTDPTRAQVSWSLVGDDQARLGSAERGYQFGGSQPLRTEIGDVTSRLVAGAADEDIAPTLTRMGVQYVWVTGATAAEQIRIGNTPGLAQASGSDTARVWRLAQPTSRAVLITDAATSGTPVLPVTMTGRGGSGAVPDGPDGRTLVLAEPADARWTATVDGVPLARMTDVDGRPAFALPAGAGALEWQLDGGVASWLVPLGQGLALLILLVLALPSLRPESRHPTTAARRAAGVSSTRTPGSAR